MSSLFRAIQGGVHNRLLAQVWLEEEGKHVESWAFANAVYRPGEIEALSEYGIV